MVGISSSYISLFIIINSIVLIVERNWPAFIRSNDRTSTGYITAERDLKSFPTCSKYMPILRYSNSKIWYEKDNMHHIYRWRPETCCSNVLGNTINRAYEVLI